MLADIIEAVNDELVQIQGVTVDVGEKMLAAHGSHPRFVWVPQFRESKSPGASGENPPAIALSMWTVQVHCWGSDLENAERLEQALMTVIRNTIDGPTVKHMRTDPLPVESSYAQTGYVLVVTLRIDIPMPEGKVPQLTDNKLQEVVITQTTFVAPTPPSASGDGNIDIGES